MHQQIEPIQKIEDFYEHLSNVLEKVPRYDLLIVMGNAMRECMGREWLGDRNENGDLFITFCAQNELVIGGTLFKHKEIQKYM